MTVKNIEKKEKNSLLITVEIDKEKFEEAVSGAYRKNKAKINVPGFRKGKAPQKIIESMYGASVFYEDAVDIIAPEAYVFAIEQEKLNTVGRPTLFDMNFGDDRSATLVFKTALYPEVSIRQYKGLEAVKTDSEVTDDEVRNEIEVVRNKNSRLVTIDDRAAAVSDTAVIDFEGFLDGVPFEGGKAEKYSLKLGSCSFIPGFEEQVVGMNIGEEKEINVTFPENYTPELAGKAVVFKVKLHEIKETHFPELDDEFAKDVSEFDTLEEYRNSVRESIAARKAEEANTGFRAALLEKLVENLEADIPDVMIEEQLEKLASDYSMKMQAQGFSLDDYLKMTGMKSEDFLNNLKPSAENQVKANLAFKKIIELEGIAATDEEVEDEYKKLAEQYKMDIQRIKAALSPEQMKEDLNMIKAEQLVCDSGVALKKEDKSDSEEQDAPAKKAKVKAAPKDKDADDKKPAEKKTAKKAEDKE